MFKPIGHTLLLLGFVLGVGQSYADSDTNQSEISGRTCKQSAARAVMNSTQVAALQSFYASPQQVQIKEFRVQSGMNATARDYITNVKLAINECQQKCEGLLVANGTKRFTCDGFSKASSKSIHLLVRDNSLLADSAKRAKDLIAETKSEVDQPKAKEDIKIQTDAEAGEDQAQIDDIKRVAKSKKTVAPASRYYIHRVDQQQESQIEL